METQVNVIKEGAWKVTRDGKEIDIWTDGVHRFWDIRVPKDAMTDRPYFDDKYLDWPLDKYALAIGSTGWDWQSNVSRWVGFDFDAITGHAEGVGISSDELARAKDKLMPLDYVEVRHSKIGM